MLKGVAVNLPFNFPIQQASTDISGTPGSGVINTPTGRFAIPMGQVQIVITSALCTPDSKIFVAPRSNDAAMKSMIGIPAAGSFTVRGSANAASVVQGAFVLFN